MNKATKNVSVILCHQADVFRPAPIGPTATNDILLVDKKDGSFEVQTIDPSGEPISIPAKDAAICVLTSDPTTILAEEPVNTTFRLKRADGGEMGAAGKRTTITVTVAWEKANRPPSTFDFSAYATDEDKVAVVLSDPTGNAFVDADIRSTSPAAPQPSTIRKRVDDFRAKRKAEIEANIKAKQTPRPLRPEKPVVPAHPLVPDSPIPHAPPPVPHPPTPTLFAHPLPAPAHPPIPHREPEVRHDPLPPISEE